MRVVHRKGERMAGMHELKQALVEIVAIAEKYDVGLGVSLCNEDSARYLLRLPTWSLVRAAQGGEHKARVLLRDGETIVGAYDVSPITDDDATYEAAKHTVHVLSATADNMREYADTVDSILKGLIKVLETHGISVEFKLDIADERSSYTTFPAKQGGLN